MNVDQSVDIELQMNQADWSPDSYNFLSASIQEEQKQPL